jgi:hypothetical protein
MIASTASPSALPAGVSAPISGSSTPVHRLAHARRLSARRRAALSQPAGDRAMPQAAGGQAQRLADHLRAVAPTRDQPRRREHVRGLALLAARPARRDRANLAREAHLARARVPPRRERRRTGRARELAGRERGFDLIRGDRDLKHRTSATRSSLRTLAHRVSAAKGSLVLHTYHNDADAVLRCHRLITTVNGAKGPFRAQIQRRPTSGRSACAGTRRCRCVRGDRSVGRVRARMCCCRICACCGVSMRRR